MTIWLPGIWWEFRHLPVSFWAVEIARCKSDFATFWSAANVMDRSSPRRSIEQLFSLRLQSEQTVTTA